MNHVMLYGRLTRDVEVKYSEKNGLAIASFSVACDRYDSKAKKNVADFIRCVAFGKTAENIGNFFAKGSPIIVTGMIRNEEYTDKQGNKRYSTNVVVNNFEFCGKKGDGTSKQTSATAGGFESFGQTVPDAEEIPF